jgi:hypothetical protein
MPTNGIFTRCTSVLFAKKKSHIEFSKMTKLKETGKHNMKLGGRGGILSLENVPEIAGHFQGL